MDLRKPLSDYKEDEDVSLERQRVLNGEAREDLLVLHSLKKVERLTLKKLRHVLHWIVRELTCAYSALHRF